ncbi:interleukin-15 receptor subunit alpha isoform X5 [Molossus molossus]|uniref:interleukin-15 receptor subunit alpha isoform X5 n=1 Tax=Molossus molossus TaxID=27622 RepID=UPI00174758AB|nr:interleukin-15 receptor subunit alpha isoform X5 [Molossus molossus]
MALQRLGGCWFSDLPALLLLLLLRPPATSGTTCSTPTSIEHANIQVKSYEANSRERYICNSGFKRKAGTSSLTKCLHNEDTNVTQWTIPSLKCIRDPSLTHQRPPSTVAPAGVTPEPESPSPSEKGTHSYNSTVATVAAISTSVSVLFGVCVVFLLVCYCKKSRQTSRTPNVPMENMEDIPMTGATNGREEDTQNYQTT